VFMGHWRHVDRLAAYVPAGQFLHTIGETAAISLDTVPGLHSLHFLAPTSSWKVPSLHHEHLPPGSTYVPWGHAASPPPC